MKQWLIAILVALGIVGLMIALSPEKRDEIHWRWASLLDSTSSYKSYVEKRPNGQYVAQAEARYDEHSWTDAQSANTVQAYEHYLQLHSEGKHVAEAKDKIESIHWQKATSANSIDGYERYLQLHSEGKHVAEAKDKIESIHWQKATSANSIDGYEHYLQLHSEGKHVAEAKDKIESIHWQDAITANSVYRFMRYIQLHSDGKHASEAKVRISALRTDPTPYEAALRDGTEVSLRKFLANFPGHAKEAEAQKVLEDITEGRDIVDLIKEKKIEVETQGSGIESVQMRMRRLVSYSITVHVPVGSYFVSARKSAQNMVSTAESKVRLTTGDWTSVSISAACANRPRDIPRSKDSFRVQRSPHQAEVARLMPFIDKAQVSFAVRQAAVWIVTDNADYDDLGILVSSRFMGLREIKELETARAMKICEEAGIDITRKRIWKDRKTVLRGLPDNELKKWLKAKK